VIEPIERGANVFEFSDSVSVFALAQAGATEVETEYGERKAIQGLHGVEDHFVVERSSEERMGMADDSRMRRLGRTGVEQSFEASGRAI
jgi:hypothetical protein